MATGSSIYGMMADDISPTQQELKSALQRIAELEAIVSLFPRTIDGKPVAPGMTVYGPDGEPVKFFRLEANRSIPVYKLEGGKFSPTWMRISLSVEQCYSSLEAYKSAQEKSHEA